MVSLGTPLEHGEGMKPLVELNPNMLVRDVERMVILPIWIHLVTRVSRYCTVECPIL